MDLSIIVVSWNTRDLLARCLASVYAHPREGQLEVWVVDNASSDGSQALVRTQFPQAQLIENTENEGFAAANNRGIARSGGRYILLLNSDAEVGPGVLAAMVHFMDEQPAVGAIGPKLVNPDGSFQASYARFPSLFWELLLITGLARFFIGPYAPSPRPRAGEVARPVDWVAGAALLVRRTAVDQVGPLDSGYFLYSEETDWCWRMWQGGWPVWYVPEIRIVHHAGASAHQRPAHNYGALYRSKLRFFVRHYGALAAGSLRLMFISIALLRLAFWTLCVMLRLDAASSPSLPAQTARRRFRMRVEQERALLRASACRSI